MTLNKAQLIGRIGKDPEQKYTQSGRSICTFSLATDESYKTKDGEKVQKTTWHNIVIWGKLSETAAQYLTKGQLVYVEGKIDKRQYETEKGEKRTAMDIVAERFIMLERGKDKAERPDKEQEEDISERNLEDLPF